MIDAVNTQRVGAAVHIAVMRAISEMPSIGNRQALEFSIGRRLQGQYGAQLRALAESRSDLSVAELCEAVIFPGEYKDDLPEASIYSGDRDRARHAKPNAPSPADGWVAGKICEDIPGWSEGLATAKASLSDTIVYAQPVVVEGDPEFATRMALAKACADPLRRDEALAELRRRTGAA